ncbi:MAG: hypothetical protein ACREPT_05675, partial [Rudaea sp.]
MYFLGEMLDTNPCLFANRVPMQFDKGLEQVFGFLLVVAWIVFDFLQQPPVRLVRRIIGQHVEDETLLDGLAHRIHMERRGNVVRRRLPFRVGARPEDFHGLVLRSGRERDEGDAFVLGTRRHLCGEDVLRTHFAAIVQVRQFLGGQHRLEHGRRCAGLRAVRLVRDHRKPLALRG